MLEKKTKVLILYAKAGGGHLSLAKSLKDCLEEYYPSHFDVILADPFPDLYASGYGEIGANYQKIWGLLFYGTNYQVLTPILHGLNFLIIHKTLEKILVESQPDVVVTNNTFATVEVKKILDKIGSKAKLVVHFADPFEMHEMWLSFKKADLYLSPTAEATTQALLRKIPKEKIKTTGFLLRKPFFEKAASQETTRKKLGIDDKFTIFLGGSGQGGGKIFEVCEAILKEDFLREKVNLLVVAGKNEKLLERLKVLQKKHPQQLFVFGFVDNIPELLTACDLVVGKAGPNFLFESILLEKPFLATGRLPGQEDGQLNFILREKMGWVEEHFGKLLTLVNKLVNDQTEINVKKENVQRIKKLHQNARKNAAEAVFELTS